MNKLNVFIDTSAFSHLASIDIELNRCKPHKWLWNFFNVHTCESVKNEFKKNIKNASQNSKSINKILNNNKRLSNNKKVIPEVKHTKKIENKWLSKYYYNKSLSKKDEGERHLICSVAELIYHNKFNRVIVVLDDRDANKFIKKISDETQIAEVWTSLDLLIYLFFFYNNIPVNFVESAIRNIAGSSSFPINEWKQKGQLESDARLNLIKNYYNKINRTKKFKQIIV